MLKKSASFVLASKALHRLSNHKRSPFPSVHDVEVPDSDSAYGIPARAIHPLMSGSVQNGSEAHRRLQDASSAYEGSFGSGQTTQQIAWESGVEARIRPPTLRGARRSNFVRTIG